MIDARSVRGVFADASVRAPAVLGPVVAPARTLEVASFLLVVVAPILFTPFSWQPFIDAKLVVVAGAALLFGMSKETFRSRMLVPVAVWFLVSAAATAAGVDPWQSLLGRENQGNGLVLIGICGMLLLGGAKLPDSLRDRIPTWIVGAGVAASVTGMIALQWPVTVLRIFGRPMDPEFASGLPPFGHPVFLGGFLSVAIIAAVPLARRRPIVAALAVAVLASGIAFTGKRGPLIAVTLGLAVALKRSGIPRRCAVLLCVTVIAVIASWSVIDATVRPKQSVSATGRFDEVLTGSSKARPYVWASSARATAARPLLGWGPANTWGANMSSASRSEYKVTGRVWQDAHNIVVESFATTGILGGLALLSVFGIALRKVGRRSSASGWAAGAVIALGLHHLLQPVNVALTPLLFLLIGIAGSGGKDGTVTGSSTEVSAALLPGQKWFRVTAVAILVAALPLTVLRLASSSAESNGVRYFSSSASTLRAAVWLQPGGLSAASHLAKQWAFDARGKPEEERRVRAVVSGLVHAHPWDVSVRFTAAEVELLLARPDRAAVWLERHVRRFPHDALAMAFRSSVEARMGNDQAAQIWKQRSLDLEPSGPAAQQSRVGPFFVQDP